MSVNPVELGCAGHLIVSRHCHWKRHTQVGNYRVSSIGNFYPPGEKERDTVGCDRYFETMVFHTTGRPDPESEGCGCCEVVDWGEIECAGYQTAGEAQAGHELMVLKYTAQANRQNGGAS